MPDNSRLKIIFFAFHSTSVLKQYWEYLNDKADCWWLTFSPYVHDDLRRMGCQKVIFKDLVYKKSGLKLLNQIINKISSFYMSNIMQKKINKALDDLKPNIVITNTTKPLINYVPKNPKTMKVLVFHSVPYKQHILYSECLKGHDLVLLPGEYHKRRIRDRLDIDDANRLKVVGWPRLDVFVNGRYAKQDRDKFVKELGLNPEYKNVLYAPTHKTFHNDGLFPKSFGDMDDAFERFCKGLKGLDVNLIVKPHPMASKVITDMRLHKIAEKYNVYMVHKKFTSHIDNYDATGPLLWSTDVLISDVSGIIMDFMILNRPIIYIEPDGEDFAWGRADLAKELRAGEIAGSIEALIDSVERSLEHPDEYRHRREEALKEVFYELDGRSTERGVETILDHYKGFAK